MFRAITGLWRWRGSALYRRTDRAEGWIALCALLLILVGGPLVGALAGQSAHRSLLQSVRSQQAERQQVVATVEQLLPRHSPGHEAPETLIADQRVSATWRAPSGARRSATLTVDREVVRGDRFPVWVDTAGALSSRPLSTATARSHSALAGVVVTAVAATAVEFVRRLAVRGLLRLRYEEWESQWAKVGPGGGRSWPAASS